VLRPTLCPAVVCSSLQETRTLMHNNVAGEMWHGPHVAPAPITA
jgi:hypothetical protein